MKPVLGEVHLSQGEAHLEAGEWQEAEAALRLAAEADPRSAVARSKLGIALVHQRRLDEAEAEFARAVALDPRYAPAWSNLGNVHREKGRTEQALEAYERAVAADPDYWVAYQNLGGLYKQIGRTDEAVRALRKATRLSARSVLRLPSKGGKTAEGKGRTGCLPGPAIGLIVLAAIAALILFR